MRILVLTLLLYTLSACNQNQVAQLETEKATLEEQLGAALTELTTLKDQRAYEPGLIHSVFVWLRDDLTEAEQSDFEAGVNSLRKITTVRALHTGPVAPTEPRPVVDNTYSTAIIVFFDDQAGQDAYQVDPIHLKFVEDHQDKWTKVLVYDNLVE